MPLGLDAYAARLPELGTPPRHGFLLLDVCGTAPGAASGAGSAAAAAPYRGTGAADADAPAVAAPGAHANPLGPRAPACLALAIDASSSMRGARFALAVQAARDLVDSLGPQDRVAIVTFERSARLALNPTALDTEGRADAHRLLDRLVTGVGTNISAGWREAADALSRLVVPGAARRIVLLTDGLPSQGEKEPEALRRMVAEGRARGLETTVIGVGENIDENLCAAMARSGDGRFHYVQNEGLLGDVIVAESEGARRLAASDVTLVLAFSPRVLRAEVLHRYRCQSDARALEVQVGAVSYQAPRAVLLQLEVDDPAADVVLGAAVARGRSVAVPRSDRTMVGFALGARPASEGDDREAASERVSLTLRAGVGPDEARRRVALEVLTLRTLAEVRSAWEGYDRRDLEAVSRRLGRARELRRVLTAAKLLDDAQLGELPDVTAMEAVMLGDGSSQAGEARRAFTSWAHNTQNSQIMYQPRKPPRE